MIYLLVELNARTSRKMNSLSTARSKDKIVPRLRPTNFAGNRRSKTKISCISEHQSVISLTL